MKKHLITFVIGLLFISIGTVVTAYELMDYQIINTGYYSDSMSEGSKKISIDDNSKCIKLSIPELDDRKYYKITYNSDIGNNIIIKYKYLDGMYNLKLEEKSDFNSCREIKIRYSTEDFNFRVRTIIDDIINNLKEKKIYNYAKDFYNEIEIVINPEYEELIRIK